ncbi:hypothetical protein H2198_009069 [Neophaeococcomyces mojaviensis]|uniref:Uncharacterized protein n=1 Tax=Neophaeococcomyces mojaviensis TaxID=3383035 RepID=A0ACC2ZW28_9EURO|nr:hypothetical protein H2198_009069 [Knufia sp. JES_112]
MSRFPPLLPSQLSPEQHAAYDEQAKIAQSLFGDKFIYKNDDSAFIGPFGPLLYTPTLVGPFMELIVELPKISGLPPAARETAILATGSAFKAGYELYAHGNVATSTSLSDRQIELIKKGEKPEGTDKLDNACDIAFDVAMKLSKEQGPLSDVMWKKASDAFGMEGAAALIHFVGFYAYTSIFLNGVAAPVPE